LHFQAAAYVEQIIQGIRPAALPMEEPAKLDIVVNQKTAGALGLTIPQSVLTQTTQLIQ
jgi:putative ABC transport system substrate-binding protein